MQIAKINGHITANNNRSKTQYQKDVNFCRRKNIIHHGKKNIVLTGRKTMIKNLIKKIMEKRKNLQSKDNVYEQSFKNKRA